MVTMTAVPKRKKSKAPAAVALRKSIKKSKASAKKSASKGSAKKSASKGPAKKRLTPAQREQKQKRDHAENMARVGKYKRAAEQSMVMKIKVRAMLKKAQADHSKTQRTIMMLIKRRARLSNQYKDAGMKLQELKAHARDAKNHRDDMRARFKEASADASYAMKKKKAAEKKMNNLISRAPHVLM